jgi:phospholipid/cholesterol/gamma-HCH transport system substrate-binding protein
MTRRLLRVVAAAALTIPLVAGCGLELEQLPAPRGVQGPTYRVTAQFGDVQNLALGAKVKLQGVVVGEVASISTHDFHANVAMDIAKKFPLARTATFQVRFTTPLGEDFIAVTTADEPGQALLADGATVPMKQTGDAPGIEDTFAALSLLLNGGGLDKLQTIATELDAALNGRTGNVRDALTQLHTVVANFDTNKGEFDKALVGLKAMATSLNSGTGIVEQALNVLPDTVQLLASDTTQVRALLGRVATLGDTVQSLLQRSQANMLADFDRLRPTLDALQASDSNLLPTFNSLINFGKLIDRATPGDYLNLSITVQFLLNATPQRPAPSGQASASTPSGTQSTSSGAITSLLTGGLR